LVGNLVFQAGKKLRKSLFLILVVLVTAFGLGAAASNARAQEASTGPKRRAELSIDTTYYRWWMSRWKTNQLVCEVFVEHEGLPSGKEIYYACGKDLHKEWFNTSACNENDISQCSGVYLHPAGSEPRQKKVLVDLPPAEVWISLEGCTLQPPENRCDSTPRLLFSADEPLPNELIIRINGIINGEPFSCEGGSCSIPIQPTGLQGSQIEFWADSSYGDSSEHYTGLVRVIPWGDFMAPEGKAQEEQSWYVDVLSTQWRGERMASAAEIWQVFPTLGGPADWLRSPANPEDLESTISYYYLAGMLIRNGAVDASGCPMGGLEGDLTANVCGVQAALAQVHEWQNGFDSEILRVAEDSGVPAQLLKNIFSRESQFWPGIYKNYREAGLGQMTSNGADTILLWNPVFFEQFCPLVLSEGTCQYGWNEMDAYNQNLLRGALVQKVNATCVDCPLGIDMSQANFSVGVFSQTLLANCQQTGQIIYNTTRRTPGQLSSYEDLWRFTLVNYNAGPGCLGHAVTTAWRAGEPLDWEHVSSHLQKPCQPAIRYVEEVTSMELLDVYAAPGAPSPTPGPTATPPPTPTPGPTLEPEDPFAPT
jgi:hypothetical protein